MDRVDVAIIGAGVVGLSVAASAAGEGRSLLVIERHESFGRESSSRNSEVIHASIYYPPDSLKGRLCLEGNERMYRLCAEHGIAHANTGKLVVAWTQEQAAGLPDLLATARANGARGVRLVEGDEIHRLEPRVEAIAALHCPSSGVVDSHALMKHFETVARSRGAVFAYGVEAKAIERRDGGFVVRVAEASGEPYEFWSRALVNSAGLESGRVAALCGIDQDEALYRIHYRKGMYFRAHRKLALYPRMLVYPFPPDRSTVGIHTVPDLAGGMRLGPYDVWSPTVEYGVDASLLDRFWGACRPWLPFLEAEDLQPDMAGIQAKRYGPGEPARDFVIREESDRGLPGLIDLIGIESPGLTASPAIGPHVARMVDEILG